MARFHNINGERIQYTQAEENETTDTGKKRAKVEINPSAEDSSD